jgi:hypothetical protein
MQATKEQAQQAIDEYNAAYAAGGEMEYPQWAADVLKACEEAERFTERVEARGEK